MNKEDQEKSWSYVLPHHWGMIVPELDLLLSDIGGIILLHLGFQLGKLLLQYILLASRQVEGVPSDGSLQLVKFSINIFLG